MKKYLLTLMLGTGVFFASYAQLTSGHNSLRQGDELVNNDYTNPISGQTYQYQHNGLAKSEWRAVYRENIIRGQAGLSLRTHYGYATSPAGITPVGPRLLNIGNIPINYP